MVNPWARPRSAPQADTHAKHTHTHTQPKHTHTSQTHTHTHTHTHTSIRNGPLDLVVEDEPSGVPRISLFNATVFPSCVRSSRPGKPWTPCEPSSLGRRFRSVLPACAMEAPCESGEEEPSLRRTCNTISSGNNITSKSAFRFLILKEEVK